MSTLAADIILHPKLSQSLALLATTLGRDKVYRLIQYLARLIAWSFFRRGAVETADRWDGLKNGVANGRRVMRVFRPIEFMQAAMRLAQRPITNLSGPGQLAQLAQIGRQLGYAGFLGTDMLVWLGTIRFLRYDKAQIKRIQDISMRCWLAGIALSLVSSSASLVKLRADGRRFALSNEMARREAGSEKLAADRVREEEERRERGRALLAYAPPSFDVSDTDSRRDRQRQTLLSQLVMDSCDVWIPANNLGFTSLNDGVIGFLGATTSYMSLQTQWRKHSAVGVRKTA